jgi:hypothetical protein
MKGLMHRIVRGLDWFLFESCDPRVVPILRIGFALMIIIQALVLWPDAGYWFTDSGVMRTQTAREILGPGSWSLLYYLPSEPWVVQSALAIWIVNGALMLVGFYSRVQAAAIFVWLVSFQNRNPSIHDGEDTVFRIFAFLMVWLPLDAYWSIRKRGESLEPRQDSKNRADRSVGRCVAADAWALRLFQVQMTAIYASTALSKLEGSTWNDGTAVWYVSRMTDNFGRWISPSWLDQPYASELATYGTLAIECFLPFGLWIPRLRWLAICLGVLLHLGIEFSMNLFLFQWVMILGLIAFVKLPTKVCSNT